MKKRAKDNQMKALLKHIKQERRKVYWEMPMPNVHLFLLVVALLLILSSYNMFEKYLWISSFFQACGTGIITGIVVFVLGNIRSQAKENADKEVEQLTALYDIIKRVYDSVPDKFTRKFSGQKYDYKKCVLNTINTAIEYVEAIENLDYSIKKRFIRETSINYYNMAVDIDKFNEMNISDDLTYNDAIKIRSEIIYIIQNAADWFEKELRKAEIQKDQVRKYPF